MAKRRPSGDGMVRKLKRGLWEGRIVVGHKNDGSPIFKYAYANTQSAISDKLRGMVTAYQGSNLTEEMRLTLAEWLHRWSHETLPLSVRASTAESYRRDIRNHITPRLGAKPIADIAPADIQKLYNDLRHSGRIANKPRNGNGLSDATICHIHNILHQALDAAVRARLIPVNPTESVQPPKKHHKPKQILNDEQLGALMEALKSDAVWHDFFYTELTTGLRRGEICALRWEDFDETDGRLHVRRSVRRSKGEFIFSDTKTYAGRRVICLPPSTAEMLKKRKRTAISEWIFPHPLKPEKPMNPNTAYSRMKTLLADAGLPSIRFHDLRHTFATHALASGVDAKTLAGILGHTNASFTLDTYTHVTKDMKETASGIVGDFMEEIFGKELAPWQDARQGMA
ncbi:MAG: site-specific integrase [Oscillospiraceae bacterium]|nr:site-specific integrase [Oscillospiraceae bacterium]